MNRVYFIGAGPGDPDLLTLKGAQCLARCAVVFTPTPFEQTFAAHLEGKTVLVPFDFYYDELLARIDACCERGNVAFLVPGDLTFYSPFQALVDALGERAEVIPGVGTANAAAAWLKKTLDLPDVCTRAIIASPRTLGEGEGALSLRELAAPGATLLIYMNNIPLPELAAQLKTGYGKNVPIAILHRLGLPGEAVVTGTLDDIVDKVGERDFFNISATTRQPSLTLVIAGETLTATVDGTWWDWRREHVWKFLNGGQ
jgi:precorrin-4/cobalt-precorrin-4 C11-methyltransferase